MPIASILCTTHSFTPTPLSQPANAKPPLFPAFPPTHNHRSMDQSHRSHGPPSVPENPVPPVPDYVSLTKRRYSPADCCQRLICVSCTFLFFALLLSLVAFAAVYTVLNPKLPKYKLSSIAVNSLNINPVDPVITAEFTVFLEADNLNRRIGIYYRDDGTVGASFRGNTLCTGNIPQFLQPGNNISLIKVDMKGKSEAGPGTRAALMEGISGPPNGEALEMHIVARIPVAVRLDNVVTIWRFRVDVIFTLMLNSVAPGRTVRIDSVVRHFEVDYMDWL